MIEPCTDYLSLLVRAGDDSLGAAERQTLDAHLATCAGCRDALAGQRFSHAAMASRTMVRASGGFADRVLVTLTRESWMDLFDFRRMTWRLAPVAAAAAFLAYVFLGAVPSTTSSTSGDALPTDVPVSAALMSDSVGGNDLVSLMLFASPDDSLTSALQETVQ